MLIKISKKFLEKPSFNVLNKIDHIRAIRQLMLVRLVVLLSALVIIGLEEWSNKTSLSAFSSAQIIIVAAFVFTLLVIAVIKKINKIWIVSIINILFDSVIISIAVYFFFNKVYLIALLYLVQIILVSIIFFRLGAWFITSLSIILFGVALIVAGVSNFFILWVLYSLVFMFIGLVSGNLSEELHYESQMSEQLLKFQENLIYSIPVGLLVIGENGDVIMANPKAANILSQSIDNIVGKNIKSVSEELASYKALKKTNSSVKEAPLGINNSVEIFTENRKKILKYEIAKIDTSFPKKSKKCDILLFQDVTNLVEAEEKMLQNEKLTAIGRLAACLAHEIRNPLSSLSGCVELLEKNLLPQDEENIRLMNIIVKETERLNNLLKEFLGYVKPPKYNFKKFRLDTMLNNLVISLKQTDYFKKGITIKENLEKIYFVGDEEKLTQAILNLMINAAESMDGKGNINIECSINEDAVKISIEDNGHGIRPEILDRIYEPFFTTKEKGTGLGLATVYKIVEGHKGQIKIKTEVGSGTKFELIFPSH